jgi:hypothetical protein
MNTKKTVTWLITYGTYEPGMDCGKEVTDIGLLDASQDIKEAETLALMHHVPEGFDESTKEPTPIKKSDFDGTYQAPGEWTSFNGFRAFQLSDEHAEVDAGNIFWIKEMRVVDPADVLVMKKYLGGWSYEKERSERWQQLRLRGDTKLVDEEQEQQIAEAIKNAPAVSKRADLGSTIKAKIGEMRKRGT